MSPDDDNLRNIHSLGLFRVISALSGTPVAQNAEITWKSPRIFCSWHHRCNYGHLYHTFLPSVTLSVAGQSTDTCALCVGQSIIKSRPVLRPDCSSKMVTHLSWIMIFLIQQKCKMMIELEHFHSIQCSKKQIGHNQFPESVLSFLYLLLCPGYSC